MQTKQDRIEELEAERDQARAALAEALAGLNSIRAYVNSPKFDADDMVNTFDIDSRIREVASNVADITFEPWGLAHKLVKSATASQISESHGHDCAAEYNREYWYKMKIAK